MPLTPDERAKVIETQTLKAEVESELASRRPRRGLSDFGKQIILLVLGFAFTTAAGGFLTYYWKEQDWRNQQSYLAQQRALDKKYAVIDRTFKEVALTTSASEDVLWIYYSSNLKSTDTDERMKNWFKTSRDWRVQSKVLSASIAANFDNPEIEKTFASIVEKRRFLGVAIMNLPKMTSNMSLSSEQQKNVRDANDLINQIVEQLQNCGKLMMSETRH